MSDKLKDTRLTTFKHHHVKCDSIYFDAIANHKKVWELRYNDRTYEVGDSLHLYKFDRKSQEYSGDVIHTTIELVFDDESYGLQKGFCVLSLGMIVLTKGVMEEGRDYDR